MKWIFFALIALNVAVFAWFINQPSSTLETVRSPLRDVGDLKIVSDVELKVRADFQKDMEIELKKKKQADAIDDELPRQEYDDFIFDEDGVKSVCRQLGPFEQKQDALNLAAGLAAYRLTSKISSDSEVTILGYWALIPALPTREEADAMVKKLKDKGIKDVRRFVTGEMINSISLGLFSSEVNAKRRVRSIQKQGFYAVVKSKQEEKQVYWLQFIKPVSLELPLETTKENFPELRLKSCNGIAKK